MKKPSFFKKATYFHREQDLFEAIKDGQHPRLTWEDKQQRIEKWKENQFSFLDPKEDYHFFLHFWRWVFLDEPNFPFYHDTCWLHHIPEDWVDEVICIMRQEWLKDKNQPVSFLFKQIQTFSQKSSLDKNLSETYKLRRWIEAWPKSLINEQDPIYEHGMLHFLKPWLFTDLPLIEALIDSGADLTLQEGHGRTVVEYWTLFLADSEVEDEHIKDGLRWCKELHQNIPLSQTMPRLYKNHLLKELMTPSHYEHDRIIKIQRLIDIGWPVEETFPHSFKNERGEDVFLEQANYLHLAVINNWPELIERLLQAGLKANQSSNGLTPLELLEQHFPNHQNENEWSKLQQATLNIDLDHASTVSSKPRI